MSPGQQTQKGRHETPEERHDRNYNELLQELRVAQTGVQILFAFLLTTAFTSTMQHADPFAKRLLATTLLLAAGATALLIAPVAVHRSTFHRRLKGELVKVTSSLAQAGLVLLMLAVSGACLLTLDAVLARSTALGIAAAVLVVFVVLWFVMPLQLRRHRTSARDDDAPGG